MLMSSLYPVVEVWLMPLWQMQRMSWDVETKAEAVCGVVYLPLGPSCFAQTLYVLEV